MTEEVLMKLVFTLCKFTDPKVAQDKKIACIEYYVNCAIDKDSKINIKNCKKQERK